MTMRICGESMRVKKTTRVCYDAVRSWENAATRGYLSILLYLGRLPSLRAALPCCAPTRTRQLSVMYIRDDGAYIKQEVPNMQVLECGCA